jgi:polyisoprenoid-binding protein YceI
MGTDATDPNAIPDVDRTRWRIDPSRSSVEFHVPNFWGLATVKGKFERYDGTLELDKTPAIELTIDAASLNTNHKKRDTHLRSGDFFDVANHPQARFASDSVTLTGRQLKVHGDLHAAGKSIPVEMDATITPVGDELEVHAETHADHTHLGMTWNRLGMLRSPSKLIVQGRLVRDDSQPGKRVG